MLRRNDTEYEDIEITLKYREGDIEAVRKGLEKNYYTKIYEHFSPEFIAKEILVWEGNLNGEDVKVYGKQFKKDGKYMLSFDLGEPIYESDKYKRSLIDYYEFYIRIKENDYGYRDGEKVRLSRDLNFKEILIRGEKYFEIENMGLRPKNRWDN